MIFCRFYACVFLDERIHHYIDGCDLCKANWMRFVACTEHQLDPNLEAFQHGMEIYYRTTKDIPGGTELLLGIGRYINGSVRPCATDQNDTNHMPGQWHARQSPTANSCQLMGHTKDLHTINPVRCETFDGLLSQSREKSYKSTACNQASSQMSIVECEMKNRASESFQCGVCDKQVTGSSKLDLHMQTH
jgi:hypothetical protein